MVCHVCCLKQTVMEYSSALLLLLKIIPRGLNFINSVQVSTLRVLDFN